MTQHLIEYKGYMIYCNCGLYYVGGKPMLKYIRFADAVAAVDKLEIEANTITNQIAN
jgi:hypothetical protein